MLPPPDMYDKIEFIEMNNFKVDFNTMTFSSDNGNGTLTTEDELTIIFDDKKDFMDEKLVLILEDI